MNTLDRLNSLSPDDAEIEFLKCCGSKNWARRMVDQRPFIDVSELLSKADDGWRSLGAQDWVEAFRSHPKIGEKKAEQAQSAEARAWSEQEQAGTRETAKATMAALAAGNREYESRLAALAAGNREYESRYGYIFIVCATGKTTAEMLAILHERLSNDPDNELRIAAEEQRKIMQLRLRKLIADDGSGV